MQTRFDDSRRTKGLVVAALSTAGLLFAAAGAFAADSRAGVPIDFTNPAVALSAQAVIDSGTCIAKYTTLMDDRSQPVDVVAHRVAARCAKQISLSAGLASWLSGKPDQYATNLKYTQDELTANAVLRLRDTAQRREARVARN